MERSTQWVERYDDLSENAIALWFLEKLANLDLSPSSRVMDSRKECETLSSEPLPLRIPEPQYFI